MGYFVYILYSVAKDRYYVGSCHDLAGRLRRHRSNHKGFTGPVSDWQLVYQAAFDDKQSAMSRERKIKAWKSRKLLERLIAGG